MKLRQLFIFAFIFWNQTAMAIEEPRFTVSLKSGPFEVRQYAPMLVAETLVQGDMDEASNRGFRRIADYIFGNNLSAQTGNASKIAMTAPVTIEPQSEKIAMTAPVTITGNTASGSMAASNEWRVHFVMPSQYNLGNIPRPQNPEVTLREVPGKYFAVYTYSGFNTESRVQDKTDALRAWLDEKKIKAIGTPQLARYDPPWTLPMFRRNEIMIEMEALKN